MVYPLTGDVVDRDRNAALSSATGRIAPLVVQSGPGTIGTAATQIGWYRPWALTPDHPVPAEFPEVGSGQTGSGETKSKPCKGSRMSGIPKHTQRQRFYSPSSRIVSARISTLRTLPVIVIGNSSVILT